MQVRLKHTLKVAIAECLSLRGGAVIWCLFPWMSFYI